MTVDICACGCGEPLDPRVRRVHELTAEGRSTSEIVKALGLNRFKVRDWRKNPPRYKQAHNTVVYWASPEGLAHKERRHQQAAQRREEKRQGLEVTRAARVSQRKATPPGKTKTIYGGHDAALFGCTATFENSEGKTLTIHRDGPTLTGLRNACLTAFALDQTFKIVAYSTPQTIFGDLDGARGDLQPSNGKAARQRKPHPETIMMGRIKMRHMVHPRLLEARRLPAQ